MTLLLHELTDFQQARIAPGEQVLWCGKGRPVAWFDGAIHRKSPPVFGMVMLMVTVCFCALMVTLLVRAGDTPIPIYFLFVPILILACLPFLYAIFGRREISLSADSGTYFHGAGRIGFSRAFSYDRSSLVHEGRTAYQVNGRNHFR